MPLETLTIAMLQQKTVNTADVYYITDTDKQGSWYYDSTDSSSVHNLGTVIVSANGMRFKRIYDGPVNVRWFGASPAASANINTSAITAALQLHSSALFPAGIYNINSMMFPQDNAILFNEGARIKIAAGQKVSWSSKIIAGFDQWIFDCEDNPDNNLNTAIPLTFHVDVIQTPALSSFLSVKWFGATGAGFDPNLVQNNYTTNVVTTGFVDDTKAIRFALTAVAASLELTGPSAASPAYGGPNTLYFPKGCYVQTSTLFVSAGTFLKGDGAMPVGGSVLYNARPDNTQIVLQAKGYGGTSGGGSAHVLRDLILETRPTNVPAPGSYVIKFIDNRFNLDSRFYNLRFSNAPYGGAVIYVNAKEPRYNIGNVPPGLFVSLHIYDSMIDVCEGDFIRMGNIGSGDFKLYNTQFFDVWGRVVNNPAKSLSNMEGSASKFEFNNCNFQGCGVGVSYDSGGVYPVLNPFLYSADKDADYIFSNCHFTSWDVKDSAVAGRRSGGKFLIDAANLIKIKGSYFKYVAEANSDQLFFLHALGLVSTLILTDNEVFNENPSAFASIQFANGFRCINFQMSRNLLLKSAGIHIYSDNPVPAGTEPTLGIGALSGNLFGAVTNAGNPNTTESIYGNLLPGIILSDNIFATAQSPKSISLQNTGMKGRTVAYETAPTPTAGYSWGDRILNASPAIGAPNSWVMDQGGSWRTEGTLQ